jgi:hypothetical protein
LVEVLAGHFTPLAKEELSMRNGVLSEYLARRNIVVEQVASASAGKIPLFKPNSTLRFLRNHCDGVLNAGPGSGKSPGTMFSVWPAFYPFDEPDLDRERAMPHLTILKALCLLT